MKMRTMRLALIVIAAVGLPIAALIPRPMAAFAATTCSGLSVQYDGMIDNDSTYGAGASINNPGVNPSYCIPTQTYPGIPSNEIEVWAKVRASSTQYAMSGYVMRDTDDSTPKYFGEYQNGSTTNQKVMGSGPTGGQNTYQNYQTFWTGSAEEMDAAGINVLTTPFNPSGTWPGPWVPYFEGETKDAGDDMFGTTTYPAEFTYPDYSTSSGHPTTHVTAFSMTSSSYPVGSCPYAFNYISSTDFQIYGC